MSLALAAAAVGAAAQNYPNRPVQLMVAYPPGGSTDVGARIVAAIAEKPLGQPIVVVNKGGAGGQVGWTEMVRQKPDGYYIGYINLPATNTVILDPTARRSSPKDFTPIINQVLDPGVIWVRADSPYKTVHDLIDAAKKAPNTIRTATTGILSRRSSRHPDDRGSGARRHIPHRASRGRRSAAQGDHGRQHRRRVRQRRQHHVRVKTGEVRALAVMDDCAPSSCPTCRP